MTRDDHVELNAGDHDHVNVYLCVIGGATKA